MARLPVALAVIAAPVLAPAAAQAASGSHGTISMGSGQSHLISHALSARAVHSSARHTGRHATLGYRGVVAGEDLLMRAERHFQRKLHPAAIRVAILGRPSMHGTRHVAASVHAPRHVARSVHASRHVAGVRHRHLGGSPTRNAGLSTRTEHGSSLPGWAQSFPWASQFAVQVVPTMASDENSGAGGAGSALVTPAPSPAPVPTPSPTAPPTAPAATAVQVSDDPYAPLAIPNPVAPGAPNEGIKSTLSFYTPDGGGAVSLYTTGAGHSTAVIEIGVGQGGGLSVSAGPGVAPPSGPQLEASAAVNPDGTVKGSVGVTVPLTGGEPSVNGGVSIPGGVGVAGSLSPDKGLQAAPQESLPTSLLNISLPAQEKVDIAIPIPLPDTTQTSAPDANGVSTQMSIDAGGNIEVTAVRNVNGLGAPDGNGNTFTVNPDLSITSHTPTADITSYPPNYQGPSEYIGGTLTNQLIDGQQGRTNDLTWQPPDGGGPAITEDGAGTRTVNVGGTVYRDPVGDQVSQTNPDGSSVSWDPSTHAVTSNDGQGTTTTFQLDGTITQQGPAGQMMWDASGNAYAVSGEAGVVPIGPSVPPPSQPDIPPTIPDLSWVAPAPPADTFTPYITAAPGSTSSAPAAPSGGGSATTDSSASGTSTTDSSSTGSGTTDSAQPAITPAAEPAPTPVATPSVTPTPDTTPTVPAAAAPADTSSAPADQSAAPSDQSAAPTDQSAAPSDQSAAPADQSAAPADQSAAPSDPSAGSSDASAGSSDASGGSSDGGGGSSDGGGAGGGGGAFTQ